MHKVFSKGALNLKVYKTASCAETFITCDKVAITGPNLKKLAQKKSNWRKWWQKKKKSSANPGQILFNLRERDRERDYNLIHVLRTCQTVHANSSSCVAYYAKRFFFFSTNLCTEWNMATFVSLFMPFEPYRRRLVVMCVLFWSIWRSVASISARGTVYLGQFN